MNRYKDLAAVKKLRETAIQAREGSGRAMEEVETMERDVKPYIDLLNQLYNDLK